ncbi:hypothetical protein LDENG_00150610 [Lucifuga dentata]|nr:hypothetical protein LDENG_00150610 [Lucifuga dentata]
MESREEEQEEDTQRSLMTTSCRTSDTPAAVPDDQTEEEEEEAAEGVKASCSVITPAAAAAADEEEAEKEEEAVKEAEEEVEEEAEEEEVEKEAEEEVEEEAGEEKEAFHSQPAAAEEQNISEQKPSTPTTDRPAPPTSLTLSGSRPRKKKVLVAPALSLSLGCSESSMSDDFPSAVLSPALDDEDDTELDIDLDAMDTPSDSESLPFPIYDLDLEDDLRRLGVASWRHRPRDSDPGSQSGSWSGSIPGTDQTGLGSLEREDMVDAQGTRWRCFSTGLPLQESRVNMSVLEPFLRVLSHGGYYGDGINDIIVFSSCYLPENNLENYQYVMDNLFRYVVGTLELMVAENYVMVYLCAGGQKDKVPGISWLRECYTHIQYRLRKNLKGFYVVHPTWYIKALITIIKPFISSKFSRKLQFVDSLQDLSHFIPTEHVQIPDCVRQYELNLCR